MDDAFFFSVEFLQIFVRLTPPLRPRREELTLPSKLAEEIRLTRGELGRAGVLGGKKIYCSCSFNIILDVAFFMPVSVQFPSSFFLVRFFLTFWTKEVVNDANTTHDGMLRW